MLIFLIVSIRTCLSEFSLWFLSDQWWTMCTCSSVPHNVQGLSVLIQNIPKKFWLPVSFRKFSDPILKRTVLTFSESGQNSVILFCDFSLWILFWISSQLKEKEKKSQPENQSPAYKISVWIRFSAKSDLIRALN